MKIMIKSIMMILKIIKHAGCYEGLSARSYYN